ncbi:MAG: IS3 family transposase [Pirellulales bacterium]
MSKSDYYASIDREPSERARRHERIQAAVREVHAESHGVDGSYKIARRLKQNDNLEQACRNTVAQAMRQMGLHSKVSKSLTPITPKADPAKQPAPNKLDRDFTVPSPNRKWVSDITYLPTAEGWVYLAVVLELFSIKSWASRWDRRWPPSSWPRHCEQRSRLVGPREINSFITAIGAASTLPTPTSRPSKCWASSAR